MSSHADLFEDTIEETTQTYRDLRSQKHALNREAKKSARYFGYRAVDPKWIGEQYYDLTPKAWDTLTGMDHNFWTLCAPLLTRPEDLFVATWTKRDMWYDRESGIIGGQWHKGKRIREKRYWKYSQKCYGKDTKTRSRALEFALEHADVESVDTTYADGHDDLDAVHFEDHDDDEDPNYGRNEENDFPLSLSELRECGYDVTAAEFETMREAGYEFADDEFYENPAMSCVGGGALEAADEVPEDYGFSIISERDFDVVSLSSDGDEVGFELIWNENGELEAT
ncbi:hypothetical protein PV11_06927 [Exophiala sideris]|uniref:Uncharacterized protein n=1 Tax=Exophiala sideris TaxID=1016849 RepID=A0A0D1YEV2_9EURO|nr:hypothetical protein PV11_06927 [Exophiala sideris]